jgi:hypothetical protein
LSVSICERLGIGETEKERKKEIEKYKVTNLIAREIEKQRVREPRVAINIDVLIYLSSRRVGTTARSSH